MRFSDRVFRLRNELNREDGRRRKQNRYKDSACRKDVTASARMGSFSGSVQGCRSKKGRRRRRPVKQEFEQIIEEKGIEDGGIVRIEHNSDNRKSEDERYEMDDIFYLSDDTEDPTGEKEYKPDDEVSADTQSWKEEVQCGKTESQKQNSRRKRNKHLNHKETSLTFDAVSIEEVAPIAATIVTNPDFFESPDSQRRPGFSVGPDFTLSDPRVLGQVTINEPTSTINEKSGEIGTARTFEVAEMSAKEALSELVSTESWDVSMPSTCAGSGEVAKEENGGDSLSEEQLPPLKIIQGDSKDQSEDLKALQHGGVVEEKDKQVDTSVVGSVCSLASIKIEHYESILRRNEQFQSPGNFVAEQMSEYSTEVVADQLGEDEDNSDQVKNRVGQAVDHAAEIIPAVFKQQVGQVVDNIEKLPSHVAEQVNQVADQVLQIGQKVVDQVTEALPDPVLEQVGQVAEQVSQATEQIVEQVASQVVDPVSSQIANLLSNDEDNDDSDDEFEAYRSSDLPEFKGIQGIQNFTILQEDQGVLSFIHDFYTFMLKKPLPEFALGMFAAPILVSVIFTLFYLPEFQGLALEETARQSLSTTNGDMSQAGLQLSWQTLFQVFMFSVSLSTGLQPELAPISPYTLVVANVNSLVAQLLFVFLSGAVFARLSQPSQPIRCSKVALITPPLGKRRLRPETCHKVLMTRYVLTGPQPSELVDVKVDLTYKYNTLTRYGTYFRATQPLKLVRPEVAYLNHGMLVRHVIDETSPLYHRTPRMLEKEDAIFYLSVVGLERSSMQPVFHVQYYCVHDGDVIWDAEFEDLILINKKNRRIVDHSFLSKYRRVAVDQ